MTRRNIVGKVIDVKHSSIAKIQFRLGYINRKVKKHVTRKTFLKAKFYPEQNIKVGDIVCVEEIPPLSKTLYWMIKKQIN